MKIAIIKYNAGNIRSVLFALERLGHEAEVTDSHSVLRNASHVIFPGVGAANSTMPYLREKGLDRVIKSLEQPFLGICLGMQLMCRHSEEGDTQCLGIFDLKVRKFPSVIQDNQRLKTPHMGWNSLHQLSSLLMEGIEDGTFTYFVHSYYAELSGNTIATCNYGIPFSAAVHYKNFYGVQFHAEKSANAGARMLENFLSM